MIRAPHIEICNRSRMRYRLRPSSHAQIQITQRQKPVAPMARDPNRSKTRKNRAAFARTTPAYQARTVRCKAPAFPKSP